MKISEIDKNLALDITTSDENTVFMNAAQAPFAVTGVLLPTEQEPYYRRMPQTLADKVSPGVAELNHHTAGGRVRFRTDSPYVSLHAVQSAVCLMSHMTVCGIGGFDLYAKEDGDDQPEHYVGTFRPPFQLDTGFDAIVRLPDRRMRTFTLNMPLYGGVNELYLGFDRESTLEAPPAQTYKAVAYYGSSITQGGCASRPGNSYQSILGRALDCGQVNLGFSGNGKGEAAVAEYIAGLELSAFVMDYDNNSFSPETLRATHDPFFQIIRKAQPDLPVIFVSRPPLLNDPENPARIEVILETYRKALAAGDKHVYFINGSKFFDAFAGDCATVDGCHPNDYGFVLMAQAILPVLEKALKESRRTIYLAGGCYWGVEKYLSSIPGVVETEVGFANGDTHHPTYQQVRYENTNHAETVRAVYDPAVLPLDKLLRLFWRIIDPVSVDRQGEDIGHQYRTGVYFTCEEDAAVIRAELSKLQARYDQPLVVESCPLEHFYSAEEYHQKYLDKNPGGYCHVPWAAISAVKDVKLEEI